jgi:hypothetical protein
LLLRWADTNNFVIAYFSQDSIAGCLLIERVAGANTVRGSASPGIGASDTAVSASVIGNVAKMYVGVTEIISYTGLVDTTATRYGIGSDSNAGAEFDNFLVTSA